MSQITENAIALILCTAQRGAIHRLLELIDTLDIAIEQDAADYLASEITRLELLSGNFERRFKADLENKPAPQPRRRFTIDMFAEQPKGAA